MKKYKIYSFIIGLLILLSININVSAKSTSSDIDLIIVFNNDIDNNVENFIVNSGGKIISKFNELGAIEVKCNSDLIPKVIKYSNVKSLAPNHKIKLSQEKVTTINMPSLDNNTRQADLYNKYQWDIKRVTNDGKSFNLEPGNHNVVVGIIDSGVNKNHPNLKRNFLGGENFVPPNFENDLGETGNPSDIDDRFGHGTHIAGTIAGNGRILGVAPNIGFKSYRIFNSKQDTNASIVTSAILKAAKDGIKVINLSISGYDLKGKCFWTDSTGKTYKLGDDMAEYSLYKRAIKYAIKQGVTVVTAAGNDSLDCSDKISVTNYLNEQYREQGFKYEGLAYELPGTIKGVISVSSTGPTDKIASYSNYGAKFIDVTAPGGDFISDISDMCYSTYENGYDFRQGTSMAAPKVSAAAALVICKYGDLTPKEVAKKLYKSAEKLNSKNSSEYFGHGLVNAYNVLIDK
ncbi:S8 family peptidase [Clostridium sp. JNZ X4-2]